MTTHHSARNWLVLVLVISVLLRVGVAIYLGDHIEVLPGIYDQLAYHSLALGIIDGKGYQFETPWYPFTPAHTATSHWSFIYPLYLAAVYRVFGIHPLVARLIQAIVSGVLLPLFAFRLGSRFFGKSAGIAAAGLVAFYGYFIYHNAVLMTDTFYMVMILWVLDLAYEMIESGEYRKWWLGIGMGIAVLLRQTFLFFVPVLLLWMAWVKRGKLAYKHLLMMAGLVVACIMPWTIRNYMHYHQFLLLNSNSGYAFYTANHPAHGDHWNPDFVAPIPDDLLGANEAELDRALMSRGIALVRADPVRYVKLTATRVVYHFRFWPTPDSNLISNTIRVTSFGLYLPLMLAGMVLSWRQWRQLTPVFLFAFILIALHVLSWPGPRYRFPVDAVFMIFAGLAVSKGIGWIRAINWHNFNTGTPNHA